MPRLIDLWDPIARKVMGIRPVLEGSVIGYAFRSYPGRSLTADDGVTVTRGQPLIELHLDSRLMAARTAGATTHGRVMFLRRELLTALRQCAHLVRTDPQWARCLGLWGMTVLARGVDYMGFTVIELPPSPLRSLSNLYMKMLLSAYHPDGEERLHQRESELVTKEIFMSRETLLTRYGEERRKERTKPKASSGE